MNRRVCISTVFKMRSFVAVFLFCVALSSSEFVDRARPFDPRLILESDAITRRNEVVVAGSGGITQSRVAVGKEMLESLVAKDAKNQVILDEMFNLFAAFDRSLAWHVTFQITSYGDTPLQFVYYLFDRNNTELLVAGYKQCS